MGGGTHSKAVQDCEVKAGDTARGVSEGRKWFVGLNWTVGFIGRPAEKEDLKHANEDGRIGPLILMGSAVVKELLLRPLCILEQRLRLLAVSVGSSQVQRPEISKERLVKLQAE